jgi:hypothetical protein
MYFVVLICCRVSSLVFCCGRESCIQFLVHIISVVTAVCLSVHRDLCACLQDCSARNNIEANAEEEPEELKRAPHSFVIHRGSVGGYVIEVTRDFRKVMQPFTASCLKFSVLQVAHWGIPPWLYM